MRATLNAIDNDHSAIDKTKSSKDHRGKLLMRTWYMLSETILFMTAPNSEYWKLARSGTNDGNWAAYLKKFTDFGVMIAHDIKGQRQVGPLTDLELQSIILKHPMEAPRPQRKRSCPVQLNRDKDFAQEQREPEYPNLSRSQTLFTQG